MRRSHFEQLRPVCPRCKHDRKITAPLNLAAVAVEQGDTILQGNLICSDSGCRLEYPIIDGIPIIVNNIRKYLADNVFQINARDDLSPVVESILGDAVGPGTPFNVARHHLSTYGWGHYGDKAPASRAEAATGSDTTGTVADCLSAGLRLLGAQAQAPLLDIGCAAGRTSFELAQRFSGLTLGIDLNFSLLRLAQRVLHTGVATFPLKRVGIVYDRQEYPVAFENKDKVDFWACDALALPFQEETFRFTSAMNVFDVVNAPRDLLVAMDRALATDGAAILATPYDWSASTPIETWVGGHSQRGLHGGSAEPLLRNMLSPGTAGAVGSLRIVGEVEEHPWNIRIHSRHSAQYVTHIVACRKN